MKVSDLLCVPGTQQDMIKDEKSYKDCKRTHIKQIFQQWPDRLEPFFKDQRSTIGTFFDQYATIINFSDTDTLQPSCSSWNRLSKRIMQKD